MKKIGLLGLIVLIGLVSCEHKSVYKEAENIVPEIDKLLPLETKHVEVPAGQVALVRFHNDTLAVVTETADVMVPRSNSVTKSFEDAITIEYLQGNNTLSQAKWQHFQLLAFEDSEYGDYDYNDLIVHVRIYQQGTYSYFYVHPVALGSTKRIALGARVGDQDYYLVQDCRKELFGGISGFINTTIDGTGITRKYSGNEVKKFVKDVPCTYGKDINWFIEVPDGDQVQRLYAVSKNYSSLNGKNMLYGLILTNITSGYKYKGDDCGYDWFNYPLEKVNIRTVYPKFDLYMQGKIPFISIFHPDEATEGNYYPAIVANGKEVSEDCLYAITFPN